MSEKSLQELFGSIDIYLFDQLLKGRLVPGMRVLDAGCGSGRNLIYFLRNGFEVFGVDQSPEAISQMRRLAAALAPHLPADNFRVGPVEQMSFDSQPDKGSDTDRTNPSATGPSPEECGFDVVLSSAVLHFARDE